MSIDSLNQSVQNSLQSLMHLVRNLGGELHPNLQINESCGRLSLHCPGAHLGETLLSIPDTLFIPASNLNWQVRDGLLAVSGDFSSLTQAQLALLNAMLELYNACNKLEQATSQLPMHALQFQPALLSWLQVAFPGFSLPSNNLARRFIETRLHETGQIKGIAYLMPMIDMLNHHPKAPKYQRTNNGDWCITVQHPLAGSTECFVRYADADSLWLAIWHGYCENCTDFVSSLSCTLNHPKLGDIHIKGNAARRHTINVPNWHADDKGLRFSNIVLERRQLPALRTLLGLAIRSKHRGLDQYKAEIIGYEIIQLIINANIHKYIELQNLCRIESEHTPLRLLFGQVAEHQLSLLRDMQTI